ncbi:hypothetical protein [Aureimonas glaciei]|uniref:Uncharacterized protein n=1 Tax=Aureimonas glaciei TaxID=1776957 RepID=A0A917DFE5_9HYPH|nr:hypothetical protein [Aureimonas glaciei]GGD31902.1 hypothetical protein GCM10011335_38700 [Aureimonas glaciei]
MTWYGLKDAVALLLTTPHDSMHGHVGLAIFLSCTLLLRRRRHPVALAFLVTAALELANEGLDARDWISWTGHVNWPETAKDIVDTLLWPGILLFATRGGGDRGIPRPDSGTPSATPMRP